MRRRDLSMPLVGHAVRRIRTIRQCRNRRRERSMTTAQVRIAQLRAVRGRRGLLAISLGDGWGWPVVAAPTRLDVPLCAVRSHAAPGFAFARVKFDQAKRAVCAPFLSPVQQRSRAGSSCSRHTSRSAAPPPHESSRCAARLPHLKSLPLMRSQSRSRKTKAHASQSVGLMKGRRQDRNADVVNSAAEKQPQATGRTVQPGFTELRHNAKRIRIRIMDEHGDLPSGLIETPI